jgi:hypothetical protein
LTRTDLKRSVLLLRAVAERQRGAVFVTIPMFSVISKMLTSQIRAAAHKSKEARADAHAIDLAALIADFRASGKVGSAIAVELSRLRIRTTYGQGSWGASQVVGVSKRLERLQRKQD